MASENTPDASTIFAQEPPQNATDRCNYYILGTAYGPEREDLGVLISTGLQRKPLALIPPAVLVSPAATAKVFAAASIATPVGLPSKELLKEVLKHAQDASHLVFTREGCNLVMAADGVSQPVFVLGSTVIAKPPVTAFVMLDQLIDRPPIVVAQPELKRLKKILQGRPYFILLVISTLSAPVSALFGLPTVRILLAGGTPSEAEELLQLAEAIWGERKNSGSRAASLAELNTRAVRREGLPVTINFADSSAKKILEASKALQTFGPKTVLATAPESFTARMAGLNHEEALHTIIIGPQGLYGQVGADERRALSGVIAEYLNQDAEQLGPYFVDKVIGSAARLHREMPVVIASFRKVIAGDYELSQLGTVERGVLEQYVVAAVTAKLAIKLDLLPLTTKRMLDLFVQFFSKWIKQFALLNVDPRDAALGTVKFFLIGALASNTIENRLHRIHGNLYLIEPRVLEAALAGKTTLAHAIAALQNNDLLVTGKNNGHKLLVRVPKSATGERVSVYAIKAKILGEEG